jgi:hypothetical protein
MPSDRKRERRASRATAIPAEAKSDDLDQDLDNFFNPSRGPMPDEIGMPTNADYGIDEEFTDDDLDLSGAEGIPASKRDRVPKDDGKAISAIDARVQQLLYEGMDGYQGRRGGPLKNPVMEKQAQARAEAIRQEQAAANNAAPTPEQQWEAKVKTRVTQLKLEDEARETLREEKASRLWTPPWEGKPSLLSEQVKLERTSPKYLLDRLLGWNHNAVLAAQFGSGKTTLGLNMARCLVDQKPFLGREVSEFEGRVGWVNGEMHQDNWIDYTNAMRIKKEYRIAAMHLRDGRLPLLDDYAAEAFVKWLVENEVRVLVMDSWRRLCAWSGVDENVNAQVEPLTARIDQIKAEAGVHAFLALAHTGRAKAEEGDERVRGATALDDWIDSRWVMIKQNSNRFFWAEKRQVEMPETALEFDEVKLRVSLGEGNRHEAAGEQHRTGILIALKETPGLSANKIEESLKARKGTLKTVLQRMEREGLAYSAPGKTKGLIWFIKD